MPWDVHEISFYKPLLQTLRLIEFVFKQENIYIYTNSTQMTVRPLYTTSLKETFMGNSLREKDKI